jgi:hypothetical protein
MKRLTLSMLTAVLFAGITAKANLASADERFAQAREAMATDLARGRALYETAALDYLSAVTPAGPERGVALYNAGNAFALSGQPGPAIACYRRAARDLPGNPFLADNLAQVRSQAGTVERTSGAAGLLHRLMGWHHQHWGLRLGILATLYLLGWGLLLRRQWQGGQLPRGPIIAAGLLILLLSGSLLHTLLDRDNANEGVVIVRSVEGRKGDGYGYESAFLTPLSSGAEFAIEETRGLWLRVALTDGSACWLPREAVDLF